jgi:hypothetical protein
MDTVKAIVDSTIDKIAIGAGGIGVTYVEFIPWALRVLISFVVLTGLVVRTYREIMKK